MLINRNNNETNHVKFVSYTGKWPICVVEY